MFNIKNIKGIFETPNIPAFDPNCMGYGAYCLKQMEKFTDKIAQVDVDSKLSQTYGDILRDSIRVALNMKDFGITDKSFISLCTNIHSYTCIPYYATAFLGAKIASLDPSLANNDMQYLLNIVKPRLIFCIPESVDQLERVLQNLEFECSLIVFGGTSDKHNNFENFLKHHNEESKFKPKEADNLFDTAIVVFSSGTTNLPKAVCLTHYGVLNVANIVTGAKRIICKKFDETEVVKYVEEFQVTHLFLAPSFTYPLCAHQKNFEYNTSCLSNVMLAGSIISFEQIKKLKQMFPNTAITQMYGLTEVSGFFSFFNPKMDMELIHSTTQSAGRMLPGCKCKLIDIETTEIVKEPFKRGEILIKSKRLLKEYLNNEVETQNAFDKDGFFQTGDVAYYDENFCFHIVDRIKEIFKYKSWHIIPAELENILLKHPAVKEVLVIGYPNKEDGDHPMAVVIPKANCTVSENEILNFFNTQVSERKKLRGGVKFVNSLPKTTTGKYNRTRLRNMIINNELF